MNLPLDFSTRKLQLLDIPELEFSKTLTLMSEGISRFSTKEKTPPTTQVKRNSRNTEEDGMSNSTWFLIAERILVCSQEVGPSPYSCPCLRKSVGNTIGNRRKDQKKRNFMITTFAHRIGWGLIK